MQRPVGHAILVLAAALAAALAMASCGSAGPALSAPSGGRPSRGSPASPSGQGGSPASGQPGTPGSPGSLPAPIPASPSVPLPPSPPKGCDDNPWLTASVNVKPGVPAPPVPVVTAVLMGTHPDCGYDRLVLHIRGPVPGYEVKYVTRSAAGRVARTVAAPGDRYLLLTLHPAQGHSQSGAATISPAGSVPFPVLRGYSVASDFEGALCIVVVVARPAAFRIGELSGRLFIDVAG